MKHLAKGILRFGLKLALLDLWLSLFARLSCALAKLIEFRDWRLTSGVYPQSFRQELNLHQWRYDPSRWSFTARGVWARTPMFRGCKVIDLCCGDGSYSYLFFSDIAAGIDAVDRDARAVAAGRRRFEHPPVTIHELDLVRDELPGRDYDFIVWNAGISYLTEPEIDIVLRKTLACSKPGVQLLGVTPKIVTHYQDHKREFTSSLELRKFLEGYFKAVEVIEIQESNVVNMYFKAQSPVSSR